MTTPAVETYMRLATELCYIRERHNGTESQEEEIHLDKMDAAWRVLTEDDRKYLLEDNHL